MEDIVTVEIIDTEKEFKWRLIVNDNASPWTTYFQGILVFMGYGVATDYWNGAFEAMKPFKITYC